MRYFRHTLTHILVGAATDDVIGHAIVPSESSMNGVQGQVHVQATAVSDVHRAHMYGCDGWLIPVDDPDTVDAIDDIWDRYVEKDGVLQSGAISLDTAGVDAVAFDEPGIPQADGIAGVESMSKSNRFFRRRKMISFQSNARGFLDGTPDVFLPGDVFDVRVKRKMTADTFSIVAMGLGGPGFTNVTTTRPSSPTETQWLQIKYMEVVLEQAWMDLVGLTEVGAETPYEEATALIADMLEPTIVEDTAAAFSNTPYEVFSQFTWDLTVPGRRDMSKALTGAS